jgi:hypothetical protein
MTHLWLNWALIAGAHGAQARRARGRYGGAKESSLESRRILEEMHASMVALVGVAFAVDALHGELAHLLTPDADRGATVTWSDMLRTFKTLGVRRPRLQQDFEWLFTTRRTAVHYRGTKQVPVPHPVLPTKVAEEVRAFTCESADRALQLLIDVIAGVIEAARKTAELSEWSHWHRESLAQVVRAAKLQRASELSEAGNPAKTSVIRSAARRAP